MKNLILLFALLLGLGLHASEGIDGALLVDIAKRAIASSFDHQEIDKSALLKKHPWLGKKAAVFVTLTKYGKLRGCIGSLRATQPLIDDLISNARRAAFEDSRFPPLKREELRDLSVEVSLLTPPEPVPYDSIADLRSKIAPGRDGIVLQLGNHQATFLPQVWEQLPDFDFFFAALCQKAGLEEACLARHPEIFRYNVQKFSDHLSVRKAVNRGLFYPKRCDTLKEMIETFGQRAPKPEKIVPRAVIVPHAGYIYSGYTANLAMRLLKNSHAKRIIVLGPSHHLYFEGVSGGFFDRIETPCGNLPVDRNYLELLKRRFGVIFRPKVHAKEHSTEVEMPFIRYYRPDAKVVELVYGKIDPKKLSALVAEILKDPDNLLIVSSDLSHYYPLQTADRKDAVCVEAIKREDPKILDNGCEACGLTGIRALLMAIRGGNLKTKVLDHRTSAEATGETKRVVGYLSAVVY